MNILVVGKFYPDGFGLHIAETLFEMGHSVVRFDPGPTSDGWHGRFLYRLNQIRGVLYSASDSIPMVRSSRIKRLWDLLDESAVDVVIVCHDFLWPEEVSELKRRSRAKVAMWFPDAMINFGRGYFMCAPYDALFFKDPYIVQVLSGVLKSPVYYLPECFNPRKHSIVQKEVLDPKYSCDVTTAGNQHSWRVEFYKNLAKYDVKIWGNPPPLWMPVGPVSRMYQGRGVYNQEKVRAFRGAKIVVNNLHYSEIWGINARAFEVAGAGAFQMVDWRPGLSQLFVDGKEVISFRGMSNLKEMIDFWLPRGEEREVVASAGMRRAHSEHTYELRLTLLLDTLAGRASGFRTPMISVEATHK